MYCTLRNEQSSSKAALVVHPQSHVAHSEPGGTGTVLNFSTSKLLSASDSKAATLYTCRGGRAQGASRQQAQERAGHTMA